ncbi:hypothetical protein CK203_000043 [Vitis vinifera]|uniref:Endonuclease/exonuclease/phosphatase domain-containing protein n=1 Tax=Vitis vinifera TaxID=29760 RepID=A0A438KPN5_VITVI|nr:hypothetical protein CK203_000043 [Vitis vinifera]
MPDGWGEKERGLGAYCGITHFLMGSGHSEKDRGGVQGLPRSRFPNGEARGFVVGKDPGEAQRREASQRGGVLRTAMARKSGNIVGTKGEVGGEAIECAVERVRGEDDAPRLEDLLRLADGMRGQTSGPWVVLCQAVNRLPSLKGSGRAKAKELVVLGLGCRGPALPLAEERAQLGASYISGPRLMGGLDHSISSFWVYESLRRPSAEEQLLEENSKTDCALMEEASRYGNASNPCGTVGLEKFQRESPGRMVIGKESSVMETVSRWELMEVNNGSIEESGEELCLASAMPLEEEAERYNARKRVPDFGCPMKLRLLSWNVREANDSSKRKVIKAMIRSQRVDLFCIQEMKIQTMSEGVVRSLGSGRFLDWGAMGAQGSAGGILIS